MFGGGNTNLIRKFLFSHVEDWTKIPTLWADDTMELMQVTYIIRLEFQLGLILRFDNNFGSGEAWLQTGKKPLPETMIAQLTDACMRHRRSVSCSQKTSSSLWLRHRKTARFLFRVNRELLMGSFYHTVTWLTLIPAWVNNHMPSNLWEEIDYPFPVAPLKFWNGYVISSHTL